MATFSTKGMTESVLWPKLRDYWLPVAFSEEVGDKPLPVRLLDERLAICRLGDEVAAFYDLCIHRGTPISLGWIENGEVVCAYHGWSYDAEGRCTRIPSVPPEHPIPKKACLTRYRAQERYGIVWVFMGEGGAAGADSRVSAPGGPEFPGHLPGQAALGVQRRSGHRKLL